MAGKVILVDSSLLIDHFRKTNRNSSFLSSLIEDFDTIAISAVTEYEILVGTNSAQEAFWSQLLSEFLIVPFDSSTVAAAIQIKQSLKSVRKSIDLADLFIAATAVAQNIPLATLNKKHFVHIEELKLALENDGA